MNQDSVRGTHVIPDISALSSLASRMAREVQAGDVVLLSGDLGAGKTAFTKELGKFLGVRDAITSPTYTLISEYRVRDNPAISRLIHIDLYRAKEASAPALHDGYLQEIIMSASLHKAIIVVEWGELLPETSYKRTWHIFIRHGTGEQERVIDIS